MGIATLEQIVLMDRYSLGLSKGKSDSLIQAAANILANRHIKDVQIKKNRVVIGTEGGRNLPYSPWPGKYLALRETMPSPGTKSLLTLVKGPTLATSIIYFRWPKGGSI